MENAAEAPAPKRRGRPRKTPRGDYTSPEPETQARLQAGAIQLAKNHLKVGPKVNPLDVYGYKGPKHRGRTAHDLRKAIKRTLADELTEQGMGIAAVAKLIKEGADAKSTFCATFKGEITEIREFADWKARHRFAELAALVHNQVPGRQNLNAASGPVLNVAIVFGSAAPGGQLPGSGFAVALPAAPEEEQ